MLRDLAFAVRSELRVFFKRCDETLHVSEAAHGAKATACFVQRGADPAQHHLAVAPAFHVARVVRDQAVQVLDGIGRPERSVERAIDTKSRERERLRKAFAQARGCARMRFGERIGRNRPVRALLSS
jgi:hypothetical protein